jgi:hypothetical protein
MTEPINFNKIKAIRIDEPILARLAERRTQQTRHKPDKPVIHSPSGSHPGSA